MEKGRKYVLMISGTKLRLPGVACNQLLIWDDC